MTDAGRNVFESGHVRKFLVVVEEEAPEVEAALAFAEEGQFPMADALMEHAYAE